MIELKVLFNGNIPKFDFGNRIHEKLVCCKDYIDSNIILNIDSDNAVRLIVDREKSNTIPVITSHNRSNLCMTGFEIHYYDKDEASNESNCMEDYFKSIIEEHGLDTNNCDIGRRIDFDSDDNKTHHTVVYIHFKNDIKLDFDIQFINKDMRLFNSFWLCDIK